ncbi:hypothetical protein [Acidovorax sp.]|uniref:hypothetical protein n=1 Tax=Acidovorax sp. TaxID=1872122 RepID=UPI00391F564B
MDSESTQAYGTRRLSGEFPQPVSPWESPRLLLTELLAAMAFAAWLLAGGMAPVDAVQVETGRPQAVAAPATTVAATPVQAHP